VALTKATIAVYRDNNGYTAMLTLGGINPPPNPIFELAEMIDLQKPNNFLQRARDEARRRGINHIKNLD